MSGKKQASIMSFFTPKNIKTTDVLPQDLANSNGKKRPPVFETPSAKKATVGKSDD